MGQGWINSQHTLRLVPSVLHELEQIPEVPSSFCADTNKEDGSVSAAVHEAPTTERKTVPTLLYASGRKCERKLTTQPCADH